jgi:hypothetical protein
MSYQQAKKSAHPDVICPPEWACNVELEATLIELNVEFKPCLFQYDTCWLCQFEM